MTAALALASVAAFLVLAISGPVRCQRSGRLLRRDRLQAVKDRAVARAVALGVVNPPHRRWSSDRKPEPVHLVLYDMPRHH